MADEFALIASLEPLLASDAPGVLLGPGDDAAVVEVGGAAVVVAVDTLVDGVHVDLALSSLADLGFKAVAVNVSDLAAMAATPAAAVVSLQRPAAFGPPEARELYRGLAAAADRWACPVVGGDVVGADTLAVSVTVVGEPAAADYLLRRDRAAPGDVVVVVGPLGLAAAGLALWRDGGGEAVGAWPVLSRAHRRPEAMAAAVPALAAARPSAGIDVSDGLGRDLGHVAAASGVAVRLGADRLPVHPAVRGAADRLGVDPLELVVGGGDDYALAVTLPPARLDRLRQSLAGVDHPVTVIGEVTDGSGVWLDGEEVSERGWEHRDRPARPPEETGAT